MDNSTKHVDNHQLFSELQTWLSEGKQVNLTVRGRSMRPMIEHQRDAVTIAQATSTSYCRGDVVLALTTDHRWVLHRLMSVDGDYCTLQGDGNVAVQEQCQLQNIIGRVVMFTRKGHQYKVNSRFWRTYALLWMSLLPLRRYLLWGYELWFRATGR